jgi:hypothetical protein
MKGGTGEACTVEHEPATPVSISRPLEMAQGFSGAPQPLRQSRQSPNASALSVKWLTEPGVEPKG